MPDNAGMPRTPGSGMTVLRRARLVVGTLLVGLVVVWLLHESPRLLRDLLVLVGVVVLVFLAGRAAWNKWKAQSPRIWSSALLGCFAVAIAGWLAVGIMMGIVRGMGESYAMIIVAPLMLVFTTLAGLAGLAAALLGIAVIAGALTKPTRHGALVMRSEERRVG